MKVESTGAQEKIYQTKQHTEKEAKKEDTGEKSRQLQNGTIFAGNLNMIEDPVAKKREEARKEAMGLIAKQFQTDTDIDTEMEERRNRIDEAGEANQYARGEIARLEKQMEQMKEEYGVEEGSEELLGIQEEIGYWKKQLYEGEKTIRSENAAIRATKQALLSREYDMTDAAYAAEDIMDEASKEIIGLLRQEAMDKMEEDREEEQEKIEEAEEKKEEQEELVEKHREEEKLEEITKEIISSSSGAEKEQLQREIEEILARQKLLQEDLKGLAVDTTA